MLNLEHEAKTLITKEDFGKLQEKYQLVEPIIQRNIYLETEDEYYRQQNSALRIRSYNDERFELTLKIKDGRSNKEYNFELSSKEFAHIINTNQLPSLDLPIEIKQPQLQYTTITKRFKLPYKSHVMEIDETLFETITDFEIEVEAASITVADDILNLFLMENNINFVESKPKIARYFTYNPK